MIQFLKGHIFGDKKFVIGDKVTLWSTFENELIEKKIAQRTSWDGQTIKLKTDLFKPKNDPTEL